MVKRTPEDIETSFRSFMTVQQPFAERLVFGTSVPDRPGRPAGCAR
jgi:hypothetical protein